VVLTGRICLALAFATSVTAVTAALGAHAAAPGTVERNIGDFGRDRILSVDAAGSDRIVIAGITDGSPLYRPWLRAFRRSGEPDQTFGGGDGRLEFEDRRGEIRALALGDGRIVVVEGGGGYYQPPPHVIRRLNSDGSPDESFGTGGSIQPEFVPYGIEPGAYATFLSDVLPDRAGRLIVVGGFTRGSRAPMTFVVKRYLADGSPDTAYGTNGETTLQGDPESFASGALAPDGGVVLSFPVGGYPSIAHLSADGTLDGSFAGGGSGPMQLAEPRWRDNVRYIVTGRRAVVLADGRLRIPLEFQMPNETEFRMALVGLSPDGRPDVGYGFHGLALGPRPALPGGESPGAAIADPSGSVIVAGSLWSSENFGFDESAMIRRFRPNGSLDRSFGDGGLVRGALPGGGYTVFGQSLALLGGDTLVAGEYTLDGKYGFWGSTVLRTLNAGYDRGEPSISLVSGCRSVTVRIRDLSAMDEVVVRAGGRVLRRTTRKRFRVRTRRDTRRLSVRATDLAGNSSRVAARLPRC
jgi:uncharacterized delta-60 repeat protein